MDIEFNKVAPEIPEVVVDTSAASEQVAEVERRIRVVKERGRICMSIMPFKKYQISQQSIWYISVFFG